jgi:hypothetical protein
MRAAGIMPDTLVTVGHMGSHPILISSLLIGVVVMLLKWTHRDDELPLINGKKLFEFREQQVQMALATRFPEMMQEGFSKVCNSTIGVRLWLIHRLSGRGLPIMDAGGRENCTGAQICV